jgi:acetyltransferase-like isoleucine patch superfamily enzyme
MSLRRVDSSLLHLGSDAVIDPSAIVGEMPARTIRSLELIIGNGAVLRSGTVIYAGSRIGDRLTTGHNVVIREENLLGDGVDVWTNSVIDYGCEIGDDVKIHSSVYVAQFTRIRSGAFLAPGVMIANDPHPGCPKSRECMQGPTIERNARIGVNVTILPFVTIGEDALIGSGSVVTRDIPARAVAYGNPARVVGTIDELECSVHPKLIDRPYTS